MCMSIAWGAVYHRDANHERPVKIDAVRSHNAEVMFVDTALQTRAQKVQVVKLYRDITLLRHMIVNG